MFVFLCEFHLNEINSFLARARAHPNSELMSESYTKYCFKREKFRSSIMKRRMVRQCCVGVMQSSCIHVLLCFFFFFSPIFKLRMIACCSLNCKSMQNLFATQALIKIAEAARYLCYTLNKFGTFWNANTLFVCEIFA